MKPSLSVCAVFLSLSVAAAVSLAAPVPSASPAQACARQSPAHTVALLELYTSEGCDSCPPADRFVSGLVGANGTGLRPEQVVPLSLHVDYWDYIGWKDVFAKPLFTERQRWLAAQANTRTVYTPEFFLAGREVRDWRFSLRGGVADAVRRVNAQPAQADIRITLGAADRSGTGQGRLPVQAEVRSAQGGQLFVALYENGLSTEVKAGENRGTTLKHDYVVRDWIGPVALAGAKGRALLPAPLPRALALPAGAAAKNLGVAAFVQNDRGEVLQALALPVCGG